MPTSLRRRFVGSRSLTTSLALAASVALAAAPLASAQSVTQPDGAIAVSSLGATNEIPGSVAGSLGSLGQPAYAEYVALGDSYAALGDSRVPVSSEDAATGCGRNLANYPNQLDTNPAVGELTDVSCGGAQIPALFENQRAGVPPQLDALTEDTDLVTLSIGGNDVGFGTIVYCITAQAPFAPGTNCEDVIGEGISADIEETFGVDGPIDDVYDAIADRAPGARVVATQYMPLMPASDEDGCGFTTAIGAANLQWAREITEEINDAVDEAARRNGHVSALPVDNEVDRSACAPIDERWTDFTGEAPGSAEMHPTAQGQRAMSEAIAAAL